MTHPPGPADPQVSVVVPHYGDPAPTRRLLEMLTDQQDVRLQVVVVDDCSPTPFPPLAGVEVVRRERNGGFGSAVNSGAARASAPLLLILNSDLEIGPRTVADLVAAAAPWQPAVAGPAVLGLTGESDWTGRHFPRARHHGVEWLVPLARWRGHRLLHEAVGHDTRCVPGVVTTTDWLVGAALLVPRETFASVGGFDEGFYMNSEEVDLQRRLRERGVPSVFVGTVAVRHEGGGSSDPERRLGWVVDSRMRYAAKWGSPRALRATLTVATAVNLVWNAGRRALGRDVAPLREARAQLATVCRRAR